MAMGVRLLVTETINFLKEDGRVVERSSSIGIAVILLSFGGGFLTGC